MTTEGEKPRRWQFSLRGLIVAMLYLGFVAGLIGRGLFPPTVERHYHKSDVVSLEQHWTGSFFWKGRKLKYAVGYYSSGQKSFEWRPEWGATRYWLPDGTRLGLDGGEFEPLAWRRAVQSDNADGTFRELGE